MLNSRLLKLFVFVCFTILVNCGSNSDPVPNPVGTCSNEESFCSEVSVSNNGLSITFLGHQLASPKAQYTTLFKADRDNGSDLTPITDLTIDDIVYLDNGETQSEFESDNSLSPDPGNFSYNILLLIDMSGSITEASALPALKSAMSNFISVVLASNVNLSGEIKIAIYYYDGDPDIVEIQDYTSLESDLIAKISAIDSTLTRDESTNLYGGIINGCNNIIQKVNSSNKLANSGALVVFTDGKDQAQLSSFDEAIDQIDLLNTNQRSINIYTIGLGGEIQPTILEEIGEDGFYFANDISTLTPTFEEIGNDLNDEVNSYYKLEYCTPRRGGQVNIEITINYNNASSTIFSCLNANDCISDDCN